MPLDNVWATLWNRQSRKAAWKAASIATRWEILFIPARVYGVQSTPRVQVTHRATILSTRWTTHRAGG